MSFGDKRAGLKNKTRDQAKNRDKGGMRGKDVIDISGYDEVTFFKPKKGMNLIDILVFEVSTNNHPGLGKPGELEYILELWVHRGIGALNHSFICPLKTFGKPCPICEEIEAKIKEGASWKDEEIAALRPTRRAYYNVIDMNEPDKGVQIFTTSYANFQKELLEEADCSQDGDGEGSDDIICFADPEEGFSVQFRAVTKKWGKIEYFEFKKFDFIERDNQYDEGILSDVYPLDKMMVEASYDEIRDAFYGLDSEEDGGEEEGTGSSEDKKQTKADPPPKEEDKSFEKEANKAVEQETSGPTGDSKCPHNHAYGTDCDSKDECATCNSWEPCAAEQDRLRAEARKSRRESK